MKFKKFKLLFGKNINWNKTLSSKSLSIFFYLIIPVVWESIPFNILSQNIYNFFAWIKTFTPNVACKEREEMLI